MPISWNEIRQNAISLSKEWASESREEAEAKSFWDGFFTVFGIKRRTVASFLALGQSDLTQIPLANQIGDNTLITEAR